MRVRLISALLALAIFLPGCRYKKEHYPAGYKGPARQDPFLAAERFLEQSGFTVSKATQFTDIPRHYAVLFTTLQSFLNFGDTELTMNWVRHGGHLILVLSGGEPWRNDWDDHTTSVWHDEIGEEEHHLLDALSIQSVSDEGRSDTTIRVRGEELRAVLMGNIDFRRPPARPDVREDDALVSFTQGDGRITLLAGARPFRNRYINENQHDHAALLRALAALDGRDQICFLNGQRVSF